MEAAINRSIDVSELQGDGVLDQGFCSALSLAGSKERWRRQKITGRTLENSQDGEREREREREIGQKEKKEHLVCSQVRERTSRSSE